MNEFEGYEKWLNVYEIQLTGSAIQRMNSWLLEDEWDWNSFSKGTTYLTTKV